jgi:AraC-like DNA-binding protein
MEEVWTSTALVSLVLTTGVSARELAYAAQLDPKLVEAPSLVPYETGIRLWDAAETLTGDRAVGLHAGEACTADRVPILGTLFGHSDHLGDTLERLTRLLPKVIRNAPVSFENGPEAGTFSYRSPSTARHGVDAMFAGILAIGRTSAGHPIVPRHVEFQSDAPDDPGDYARFFGVRPGWGATTCSMQFDAGDLARPFRGAAPSFARVLETQVGDLLDADGFPDTQVERAVAEAVHRCLDRAVAQTLAEVSEQLGRSARSLQRELADEGCTFRAVRDQVLAERARTLVAESDAPIGAIATRLGFASRTSFERAYRRWTGEPPAKTRAETGES